MLRKLATLAAAAAMTAGCAVWPNYEQREYATADDWIEPAAARYADTLPDEWWLALDDEALNAYLEAAVTYNLDIKAALARVDEARAARGIARSVFWPQLAVNGSYTSFEQSLEAQTGAPPLIEAGAIDREIDFYNLSLDASWEIDVFGGNRRRAESAAAGLEASIAAYDGVRLAALSETAAAYFELRGAQQRLAIVESNIAAQQRTLELTRRKVETGLGRKIDQLRAEAQLDAIGALVPALRASIRASTYRLGVLTGKMPEEMRDEVAVAGTLPDAPLAIPVGMRADVLRRRPDVVAAERELAAATARVGVAKADFFPRFILNASYGFEAGDPGRIGTSDARTTALVPFVSWPVFQGGRLRASLEGANARATAAAFDYERIVLEAIADAESAISAYAEELDTYGRLTSAATASREAATIAQKLYEQGLSDFLTVLDADRRRDEAEDQRAQSHTRLMLNLTRVYKALGGGWGEDVIA